MGSKGCLVSASFFRFILSKLLIASMVEDKVESPEEPINPFMNGNGYESFTVTTFNFIQSTQKQCDPSSFCPK